ncbi:MAG: hypothetical protein U0929_10570 [Planctomycetaceae bacterium]
MSVQKLIDEFVPYGLQSDFFTDVVRFEAVSSNMPKMVFVAALWSGQSQLAFRALCSALNRFLPTHFHVLVLDTDIPIPSPYNDWMKSNTGKGEVALVGKHGEYSTLLGDDLNSFESGVDEFLAHFK